MPGIAAAVQGGSDTH